MNGLGSLGKKRFGMNVYQWLRVGRWIGGISFFLALGALFDLLSNRSLFFVWIFPLGASLFYLWLKRVAYATKK